MDNMKPVHELIVKRIEGVRKYLGLNRSEFCRQIGLTAQTYSNFIGKQGSKPNVDLIWGVIHRWNVDARWLFDIMRNPEGEPPVFLDQGPRTYSSDVPFTMNAEAVAETILRIPNSLTREAKRLIIEFREPKDEVKMEAINISIGDGDATATAFESAPKTDSPARED